MANLKVPVAPADHTLGEEDAPVTLVEYGDYECPHCGRAHPIVNAVRKHFGKQLRFVFRNFPLTEIHPHAEAAAEAAEFAGAAGHFWEMHDGIYEHQSRLGGGRLLAELVVGLGLSSEDLAAALKSHEYLPRIKSDFLGGVRSGVNGTPTFFINGVRYDGAAEFEELVEAIDEQLSNRKADRRRAG
ncbi:MAG: DsbA family protein [Candidatus Sulfotelmatobacter sp.]